MFGIDGALEISRACRSMGYLSIDSEEDRRLIQLSTLRKRLLMSLSGVLALGLAMSCSSAETSVEPDATPVSAAADTEELADSESVLEVGDDGLPPAVVPPEGEFEPGDARLGPDGHYDYRAPDFVKTSPCSDPKLMARLDRLGQRKHPEWGRDFEGLYQVGCVLGPEGLGPIAVWRLGLNNAEMVQRGQDIKVHRSEVGSWVTAKHESGFSDGCSATFETPKGSFGFLITFMEVEHDDFHNVVCQPVNEMMELYLEDIR